MSLATFTPETDRLSILQPAKGHVITVNTFPEASARVVLIVSARDHAKVVKADRHFAGTFTVTDLMTGLKHRLTGADCGLGCRCALTFAR
jgi:hypothetical protein